MAITAKDARAFVKEIVAPAVYPERVPLDVTARHLPGEPLPADRAVSGRFEPFRAGDRWGGMWATTWFRFRATVPAAWAERDVVAVIHLGGARTVGFSAEGLVWTADLRPVQGLHHEHREYRPVPEPTAGSEVDFYVEAAANPIPRWHVKDWPRLEPDYDGPPLYALEQADLAVADREVEALALDLDTVIQIAEWMEPLRAEALAALDDAVGVITAGGAGAAAKARAALRPVLDRPGSPPARRRRHTVTGVGHAHIDTAWLWPLRETRRKCARSFANQLRLLERYPEHQFVCSQAVQYDWIRRDHPDLYEAIRSAVAAGRWEPVGGMWVEADSNVPSGESLIRQLVHGKRFFLDQFGVETHELWIPDVFGYSAALPQIAAAAGVDVLITQKMSWNDTNQFPHTTFWWEGHDGTRLLAHFPPANTYNGNVSVAELLNDERNFKDGDHSDHTLYPYGYGDGGGGPSAQQLEAARRLGDLEGLPRLVIRPLRDFLAELKSEAAAGAGLETWVGELYLEAHRATATTHADVKLGNRRGEEALRAAELGSVAAGLDPGRVRRTLAPLWESLLLHQFHDIIPGSSIAWVYRDAAADHAAILEGCRTLTREAHTHLAPPEGPALTVFNPSTYDRDEVVELPGGERSAVSVPGCGWAPVPLRPPIASTAAPTAAPVEAGPGYLDNGILRVTYDPSGLLTSVWDHEARREVLAAGERGNLFQLHEDHPKAFDAWDVDREYLDHRTDLDGPLDVPAELVENDGLRAAARFRRSFGEGSAIQQTIRLTAGSRRIEFHTEVDWQERHRFLKVAFPVAVHADRATYEIQHGHVERPTHANTTWDVARFEVCGHRWADLAEPGYGVALLNDCKYGYDVHGHTLRLSLLRGPGYPDPDADRGHHRFAYALLPHIGDRREGRVVEEAEAFNLPLVVHPGRTDGRGRIVAVDRSGVSIEALKPADDGPATVLRLCEVHGSRGPATITLHRPFVTVERTDALERPLGPVDHDGNRVTLHLRPFELVTLRFDHGG